MKNFKLDKLLSLLVVFLMVVGASITVNKSVFGHKIEANDDTRDAESISNAITSSDGKVVINTKDLPGCINGYAGPVPLEISISDGKITDISTLPNSETPSFFERASKLFESWIGKTPEEAEKMEVDAVSGATYSSNAIISNVRVGLAIYQGDPTHNSNSLPFRMWVALAVVLTACILPLFVHNKIYHHIQLFVNVIVLGFWTGQYLDFYLLLNYTSTGFNFPTAIVALVMLVAAFIYPLFGHPQHYCNHICPLGSAQQLMAQASDYKIKISPKVIKYLDWFRKILWAVLMLLLWADCLVEWMDLELFQAFRYESASLGIVIAAVIFIGLSMFVARPYCRFVCPIGSLFKRSENIG